MFTNLTNLCDVDLTRKLYFLLYDLWQFNSEHTILYAGLDVLFLHVVRQYQCLLVL